MLRTLLLGVSLAMDAFAVSVAAACTSSISKSVMFRAALTFGIFQFAMPMAGWFFASFFVKYISAIDHWIAFVLLGIVGGRTLVSSFRELIEEKRQKKESGAALAPKTENAEKEAAGLESIKTLLALAVAMSIDALSVGVIYASIPPREMLTSALVIGAVTFIICAGGFFLGKKANNVFGVYAQIAGGAILIAIGARILFIHLTSGG